jgi:transcriptional regulator with GAF, ATPase, and Fis domain
MEYKMLLKSGKKIPFLGSISLVLFQGKKHLVGQAIDISKQKDSEKDLKAKIKEINKLRRILEAENIYFRTERQNELSFEGIVGNSEALQHVLFRVEKVAPMDTTVLIEGETGTGKELITMAIHNLSHRKNKAFIKVNCANFSPTLIESELFGHERGAFTGAASRKIGWFELADGGTLFLDEIGELPMNLQTKLLQFLQTGEFHRLGGTKTIRVNVRLIAATNRKLDEMVKENLFRKDLFYRLNVYPITVAPLRDRKADIPLLTRHFVKQFNQKLGKKVTRIPASVMKKLENYAWPGNIRELQNVIERAVILSPDDTLVIENLFSSALEETEEWLSLREYERQYIVRVLEKTLWRVEGPKGAARILDMNPDTLRSRMRKLGIKKP